MNVTPEILAAAEACLTRLGATDVREALGLDAYYGSDRPSRDSLGVTPTRGRRNVPRTPDELLGTITVPGTPGGRAVVS